MFVLPWSLDLPRVPGLPDQTAVKAIAPARPGDSTTDSQPGDATRFRVHPIRSRAIGNELAGTFGRRATGRPNPISSCTTLRTHVKESSSDTSRQFSKADDPGRSPLSQRSNGG